MIHHPLILVPKLVVLILIIVALAVLYGVLTPDQFAIAVGIGAVVFILFCLGLWIGVLRLLGNPESKMAKGMVLSHRQLAQDGFSTATDELKALAGARGVTASALRPSGTAVFDQKRVSVVAEGQFIPANSPVEVVAVEGSRVAVRLVAEPDDNRPA